MARAKKKATTDNGANLGFEAKMFLAADKLRGNMDASEYKHVVLGLIFLKYISDAFEAMRSKLAEDEYANPEDPEEYLAENVFWVPSEARWSYLQDNAMQLSVGKLVDDAMVIIEGAVDEPFGDLVSNWNNYTLGDERRPHALCESPGHSVADVRVSRYQLLHRTATAIYEAQRNQIQRAIMLVGRL